MWWVVTVCGEWAVTGEWEVAMCGEWVVTVVSGW